MISMKYAKKSHGEVSLMEQDTIENVSWPKKFFKKIFSLSFKKKKDFVQLFSADATMF